MSIKDFLHTIYDIRRIPYLLWLRSQVKNRHFVLVASNCIGGLLLHDLNMAFNTPTINLAIRDFDKMASDLDHYLSLVPEYCELPGQDFPHARLGDVIIECTHYQTFDEFLSAWNRRLERYKLCLQQGYEILIITADRNLSEDGGIERFLQLPYRKVCFTDRPDLKGKEFAYVPDRGGKNKFRYLWRTFGPLGIRLFEKVFDFPAFLNNTQK